MPDVQVGDLFWIDGFASGLINVPSGNPLRVVTVTSSTEIVVETYSGGNWASGSDEASVAVTISGAPLPSGAVVSAGFWFYVPVRFDDGDNAMSEITAGWRESAYANFNDIKLREVFE